jgi:hypothetical protein
MLRAGEKPQHIVGAICSVHVTMRLMAYYLLPASAQKSAHNRSLLPYSRSLFTLFCLRSVPSLAEARFVLIWRLVLL